jgi:hypothetical protein
MEIKDMINKLFYEQDRDPHTTGNLNKRNYYISELMDFDDDVVARALRSFYTADRFPKIDAIRQKCRIAQNEKNRKFHNDHSEDCNYCGNIGLLSFVKIKDAGEDRVRTLWSMESAKSDAMYYTSVAGRCFCTYGKRFKSYPKIEINEIPPFLKEYVDEKTDVCTQAENISIALNRRVNEVSKR